MQHLTLEDIREVCYEYAKAHLTHDEPLPSFDQRFPNKLESALAAPRVSVGGQPAYATLPEQAAVLFYEMIKQHPFLNGNKRIACVSMMAYLALNRKWMEVSWRALYDIAVLVADSSVENREGMRKLLSDFIANALQDAE